MYQPELKKRELEGHVLAESGVVTEQPALHSQAVCMCDVGGRAGGVWVIPSPLCPIQRVSMGSRRAE